MADKMKAVFLLGAACLMMLAGCKPSGPLTGTTHTKPGTVPPKAAPTQPNLSHLKAVAAGNGYSLGIKEDGTLLAWGDYENRILGGIGTQTVEQIDSGVQSVAVSDDFFVAVKADGSLWVWGSNEKVSPDPDRTKQKVLDGVAMAAAGKDFILAVMRDGTLWAWGANAYGQLADGTEKDAALPIQVMTGVREAAAGDYFSLIWMKDGTLMGCGLNQYGQLQGASTKKIPWYGSETVKVDVQGVPVKLLDNVIGFAAGADHTMALDREGNCWASGSNNQGQIGDGYAQSTAFELRPGMIEKNCRQFTKVMQNVAQVFAGGHSSGAVKKDGTVWLWGENGNGQIGDGSFIPSLVPKQALDHVLSASVSLSHTLAVKDDQSLWAWGRNLEAELGGGSSSYYLDYVRITDDVRQVVSSGTTTLVLKNDGAVYACGSNDAGQLGNGTRGSSSELNKIMEDADQIAIGVSAAFAVKKDGTLWGWGSSVEGTLGNGKTDGFSLEDYLSQTSQGQIPVGYREYLTSLPELFTPAKILDNVNGIMSYQNLSMAIKKDSTLWGWGADNGRGLYGDGFKGNTTIPVQFGTGARSFLCADVIAMADGTLMNWGSQPLQAAFPAASGAVTSAVNHFGGYLAVTSDGALWAWGKFGNAELPAPVQVESGVSKITSGLEIMALTGDHTLYSLSSYNLNNFLAGLAAADNHLLASNAAHKMAEDVQDVYSPDAAALNADNQYHFIIKTDGSLWATGCNKYGQFGDGKVFYRPRKVSEQAFGGS